MRTPSLEGVDLKLGRADECLALLNRERTMLLNAKGNAVVGHFDPDSGDHVFRVPGDPPSLALGIAVSEFAPALRSGLDNMLRIEPLPVIADHPGPRGPA